MYYMIQCSSLFICHDYVEHLKVPISLLPYDLTMSTPTNVPAVTSLACTYCRIFQPCPLNCHDKTLIFKSNIGEVSD